ncbi:hypothetical protein ADUPG1_010103 [Aduncisulcus paluster]|uniref:Uncharacterized protein n=1 Tax=Aduncisulcus paluster TaxID=2918883 RepID=A0ABQ5L0N4_9EUKA|nr:hypothetical protein ADUPG1_010103 [Aduncisulcus paluster]
MQIPYIRKDHAPKRQEKYMENRQEWRDKLAKRYHINVSRHPEKLDKVFQLYKEVKYYKDMLAHNRRRSLWLLERKRRAHEWGVERVVVVLKRKKEIEEKKKAKIEEKTRDIQVPEKSPKSPIAGGI